jgi:multiple sugar transport system substrate-binding protein
LRQILSTLAAAALLLAGAAVSAQAQVLFWSNQAAPVESQQLMRDQVLKNFPGGVDFRGQDQGPYITRIQARLGWWEASTATSVRSLTTGPISANSI